MTAEADAEIALMERENELARANISNRRAIIRLQQQAIAAEQAAITARNAAIASKRGGRAHPAVLLGRLQFSDFVRDGRKLLGMTQAELATRSGVSREAIARLEAGHGGMAARDLERLLAALDEGGVALLPSGRPDLRDAPGWAAR